MIGRFNNAPGVMCFLMSCVRKLYSTFSIGKNIYILLTSFPPLWIFQPMYIEKSFSVCVFVS